jgi:hypothetical protein
MIDEETRQAKIEEAKEHMEKTFLIYKPTWDLIIKPLEWSMGKTAEEIMTRRGKSRYRQDQMKSGIQKRNWQVIIETLNWVLEDTQICPIESRWSLLP